MADKFIPKWIEQAPVARSFRSIFKYGDPQGFKHPSARLFKELKESLGLSDKDFEKPLNSGNEIVEVEVPSALSPEQIARFSQICGEENISTDTYERLKYSTGKTVEESMKLRAGKVEKICDIVVHPRHKEDVAKIIAYCNEQKIPVHVYGGGSSVNMGFLPERAGLTMVLMTHLNKVLSINELNHTAKVQAGILGPAFEDVLNHAQEHFGTKHNFTCGHFPQSFEYSSVGGWFATLGSGQQSSYYGDAKDLCLGIVAVTPKGEIITHDFPATANGPKVLDMFAGSEACFGIIVELTWKLHRHMPENRQYFGFIMPDWEAAVNASREISQSEFGMPSVFRISDPEETQIGLKLYGIEGTIFDKIITLRGYKAMKRCLFLAAADGDKDFAKTIKKKVKKIVRRFGGMYLTAFPVKQWEPGRYRDPYMREDLMDYGILIDTLETSVKWDNLHTVHKACRDFVKSRPNTICMSHCSHFYSSGTNLYFIYTMAEQDIDAYLKFQSELIDTIENSGGSLSHHHGVGRMIGRLMPKHLGNEQMDALKALKQHFDPNNIMNPGNLNLGKE